MSEFKVGDRVAYVGTITSHHGVYSVVRVPEDPRSRGYILQSVEDPFEVLSNVHHDSIRECLSALKKAGV